MQLGERIVKNILHDKYGKSKRYTKEDEIKDLQEEQEYWKNKGNYEEIEHLQNKINYLRKSHSK